MKTLFGTMPSFEQTSQTILNLIEVGIQLDQINVIVKEDVAQDQLHTPQEEAKVDATDALGALELQGLPRLLAGEKPLTLLDGIDVIAGGELATIIAKTAANSTASSGLESTLVDFALEPESAKEFAAWIHAGRWLLFARVEERQMQHAFEALRDHDADKIITIGGQ